MFLLCYKNKRKRSVKCEEVTDMQLVLGGKAALLNETFN